MAGTRNKLFAEPVPRAVHACRLRHAKRGQSLVVGFSGGLDSTVLLHAANRIAPAAECRLSALHIHHGLSPSADAWAESCASTCRRWAIPLTIQRVEVSPNSGEGIEAAARRLRHAALSGHSSDWILLAHHADDQAETILHNLLRGAGVRGASAMPEARGRVLRPLLDLRRAELLAYAQAHDLVWIEDESNADIRYTRNFLRHKALPVLTSRFPRAAEQLAAAALRFQEADGLLESLAALDLRDSPPKFPLSLKLFQELPDARARNLLRAMLNWHHVQVPDERRMQEFVRQLRTAGSDRHPRIDCARYELWCAKGRLHFRSLDP